jgi:hypothetical protein
MRFIPAVSLVQIRPPLPNLNIRPIGQAVKTPPFHGGNRGSSPLWVTMFCPKTLVPQGFSAVCHRSGGRMLYLGLLFQSSVGFDMEGCFIINEAFFILSIKPFY